jgi:hypothetical protein
MQCLADHVFDEFAFALIRQSLGMLRAAQSRANSAPGMIRFAPRACRLQNLDRKFAALGLVEFSVAVPVGWPMLSASA